MTDQPPSPRRVGFIRVSTPDQRTDRQVNGLRDRCDTLYIEEGSAVADERPVFQEMLASVRAGDSVVVWDLDRAFRSTVDAVMTAEALRKRGVHFRIVSLNIDTATPEGELYYTLMAAMAQFERRMLSRRTKEGMAAAKRRGVRMGRPRKLDAETIATAHRYVTEQGYPCAYVAKLIGVSRITLQRAFKRMGLVFP